MRKIYQEPIIDVVMASCVDVLETSLHGEDNLGRIPDDWSVGGSQL